MNTTPETMTKHDFSDLTPPAELVNQWRAGVPFYGSTRTAAAKAARWGAEQAAERLANQWPEPITGRPPTEADGDDNGCVQFLCRNGWWDASAWHIVAHHGWPWLHTPRWQPPAPPTLKEQALMMLGTIEKAGVFLPELTDTIRRALEADS